MLKQYDTPSAAVAAGEEAPPGAEPDDGKDQEKNASLATVSVIVNFFLMNFLTINFFMIFL